MKTKWPLFVGIILLTLGIILKNASNIQVLPLILILSGVAFKVYYIINKIVKGEYKPGYEILLLAVGLAIFMIGMYFKKHNAGFSHLWMMIPGIVLKVSFILVFILKTKRSKA